jgi:signal transduction histidine kinase
MNNNNLITALNNIGNTGAECLNEVIKIICHDTNCEYGALLSLNSSKKYLEFDAIFGYPENDELELRINHPKLDLSSNQSIAIDAYRAMTNGIISPIIKKGDDENQYVITKDVTETLCYAINHKDSILSVLGLESRSNNHFRNSKKFKSSNNSLKLYTELIRMAYNSRQSLVYKFIDQIDSINISDINILSDEVTSWIQNEFKVTVCSLYTLEVDNSNNEYLECRSANINGKYLSRSELIKKRHKVGEGLSGWVAELKSILVLPEFENPNSTVLEKYEESFGVRPNRTNKILRDFPDLKIKSYIGAPIMYGNTLKGVLQVFASNREYAFSEERMLEIITNKLGSEINKFQREQRRDNLFLIPNIETKNHASITRDIVDAAIKLTNATHGFYLQITEEGHLVPTAVKSFTFSKNDIPEMYKNDNSFYTSVFRNHDSLLINDISELSWKTNNDLGSLSSNSFIPEGVSSLLIVPVFMKEKELAEYEDIGALVLMSTEPYNFENEEIIITALADIVSYHIWGSKKIDELETLRKDKLKFDNAVNIFSKITAAQGLSVSTIHTGRRLMKEIKPIISKLLANRKLLEDKSINKYINKLNNLLSDIDINFNDIHKLLNDEYIKPSLKNCNVRELINEARDQMQATFEDRMLTFQNSIKKSISYIIEVDPTYFKVIFVNMMANSIEAKSRKIVVSATMGKISIAGFQVNSVDIKYEDDGIGIPKEEWKNVFEPFYSIRDRKEKGSGTGMGLYVNSYILNLFNGNIEIQKSILNKGTSFKISIPLKSSF